MSWEPLYGLLILFSTAVSWASGLWMVKQSTKKAKKGILFACIASNLLVLFFFKYADFGWSLLLPVGISFYTLQVIGYTIDVFRGDIEPERHFGRYALFVSFFPQLVAGPIERAKNLLPQFYKQHFFDNDQFLEGIKMMMWGYFMKLCVAERVAPYVNAVFNYHTMHNGTSLSLATFFFSFQIYCDFAGYSLIAMGTAKCLGFELMRNFNRPYLSHNLPVFWHRWHISLSQWFRDYVYIPMGGNRCALPRHLFNLFVVFAISGLWHGANWTFVLWGTLHGIFMIVNVIIDKYRSNRKEKSKFQFFSGIFVTFGLVMLSWVFFRANSISDARLILKKIFTEPGMLYKGEGIPDLLLAIACIGLLMVKEIKDETKLPVHLIHNKNNIVSVFSLASLICVIILTAVFTDNAFIYFQF
jgi:D-alanyl-lipoteichoic acid acyltransferase DltB (MBOAT superfamily)